jgi:hypothetical protein
MNIVKVGRKWRIEGEGAGWALTKKFPRKWKVLVAIDVLATGGRWKDYCIAIKAKRPPAKMPTHAIKKVQEAFEIIKKLVPTCEEIDEYAKLASYGVVTSCKGQYYWGPKFHNTWGLKEGGRVHIDLGCCGNHLMLNQHYAYYFIEYIKKKRGM